VRRLLLFIISTVIANVAVALTFTTHFPLSGSSPRAYGPLVSPADPNIVYELAYGNDNFCCTLYRSSDGGATFTKRGDVYSPIAIDPVDPNLLYDAAQGFVRRSEDGGLTWTTHRAGFPNFTPTPTRLVVTPKRTVFVASTCYSDHTGGGVFRSDDRAESWSGNLVAAGVCVGGIAVDPVSEEVYASYEYELTQSTGRFLVQIVASARNPDVRYALAYEVVCGGKDSEVVALVSTDAGKSWQGLTVDGSPRDLALDESSGRLFLVTSTGLFFSDDRGASWLRVSGAPAGANFLTLAGSVLFVGTAGVNYRVPLATLGPFTPLGPLPESPTAVAGLAVDPNRSGVVYAVGPGAWRSSDSGQHWESIDGGDKTNRVLPAVDGAGDLYALGDGTTTLWHYSASTGRGETLPLSFGAVSRLAASPLRRGVLYAAGARGLFISNDGGHGWQQVPGIAANEVAVDPTLPDVVYVGAPTGLLVSADAGTSWRRLDNISTAHIAVAPSRPSTIYRIARQEVQRSDDGGTTWRRLTSASYGRVIAVDPLNADSVWLDALEHSIDGGKTWTSDLGGLAERAIAGYVIDRDGTHLHLYLRLYGSGEFDAVLRGEHRRAAMH